MFVSSTGLRVEVRMSTIGWLTRSSNGTQTTSTTTATRNRPNVRSLVQPHVPPFEMASSRLVRAIDSSTAPRWSNLPRVRMADSGTIVRTATISTTPTAAEHQKMACQPRCS